MRRGGSQTRPGPWAGNGPAGAHRGAPLRKMRTVSGRRGGALSPPAVLRRGDPCGRPPGTTPFRRGRRPRRPAVPSTDPPSPAGGISSSPLSSRASPQTGAAIRPPPQARRVREAAPYGVLLSEAVPVPQPGGRPHGAAPTRDTGCWRSPTPGRARRGRRAPRNEIPPYRRGGGGLWAAPAFFVLQIRQILRKRPLYFSTLFSIM